MIPCCSASLPGPPTGRVSHGPHRSAREAPARQPSSCSGAALTALELEMHHRAARDPEHVDAMLDVMSRVLRDVAREVRTAVADARVRAVPSGAR